MSKLEISIDKKADDKCHVGDYVVVRDDVYVVARTSMTNCLLISISDGNRFDEKNIEGLSIDEVLGRFERFDWGIPTYYKGNKIAITVSLDQ